MFWGSGLRAVTTSAAPRSAQTAPEQIDGSLAELPRNHPCRRAGQAVGDVEERPERPDCAAAIGRQHTLQCLNPERRKDRCTAEAGDECTGKRDDFLVRVPQDCPAGCFDDRRRQRDSRGAVRYRDEGARSLQSFDDLAYSL
jgi:hypothetical protein